DVARVVAVQPSVAPAPRKTMRVRVPRWLGVKARNPATVLRLPSRLPPQNSRSPAKAVTNRARAANASVVVTAPGPRPASNALQAPLLYAPLLLRNEHRPGNARSPAGSLLPVMTIRLAP